MEGDASEAQRERAERDRATLKLAMGTMSVGQLHELRSTIVRLKHLPFTKLTEVLFTEADSTSGRTDSPRIREDESASADGCRERHEPAATRRLLEDVEEVLRAKEAADEQ